MSLIPSGLFASLPAALWPDTGDVQENTQSATASHKTAATYTNVTGLTDISCRVMPVKSGDVALFGEIPDNTHKIQLKGAYSAIEASQFFLIGTTRYKILHASTDGSGVVTTLLVQRMEGTA